MKRVGEEAEPDVVDLAVAMTSVRLNITVGGATTYKLNAEQKVPI